MAEEPYSNELAAELKKYKQHIEAEFAAKEDEVADNLRDEIVQLKADAVRSLRACLNGADSESVRLSATKFVIQIILGKKISEGAGGDSLTELMKELRATPKPTDEELSS